MCVCGAPRACVQVVPLLVAVVLQGCYLLQVQVALAEKGKVDPAQVRLALGCGMARR